MSFFVRRSQEGIIDTSIYVGGGGTSGDVACGGWRGSDRRGLGSGDQLYRTIVGRGKYNWIDGC